MMTPLQAIAKLQRDQRAFYNAYEYRLTFYNSQLFQRRSVFGNGAWSMAFTLAQFLQLFEAP